MQAALLLKDVEQSKDSHHLICSMSTPRSRKTRFLGAFTSGMGTRSFCTVYVTTLETLQCQRLPDKSSGVQGTEQCLVNAR